MLLPTGVDGQYRARWCDSVEGRFLSSCPRRQTLVGTNFVCLLSLSIQSSSLISSATAAALLSSGAVDYCLHVLKSLLEYWKSQQNDEEPIAASQLLKPHTTSSPPDMSPFFLRQYVKVSVGALLEVTFCSLRWGGAGGATWLASKGRAALSFVIHRDVNKINQSHTPRT